MESAVISERLETRVAGEYDVAVCGGGFAGISAALAAARQGRRIVLFEKQFLLGGLGTSGIVTIYLPICDGLGRQVSFGIAEELLRLSISEGAEGRYPDNWLEKDGSRTEKDKRFQACFNPQVFAILAEKLLLSAGVDILYGTYVVNVFKKEDTITHLVTENKSGRQAYQVKSVVDATSDSDIAHFAYAPTDYFRQGNVLAAWYYSTGREGYRLHPLGCADIPEEEKTEADRIKMLAEKRFVGLDGKELSRMTMLSHDAVFQNFTARKKEDESYWPVTMATIPQIRMTRKLAGEYELSDKEAHQYFEDSIGMVSNWKKRGPVYEVPFRTLYCKKVRNLITAGRCTSVTETMWDIMRVIPCCAVTGQAAGTAAAMTDDFGSLDIMVLQKMLRENGVVLHEGEIQGKLREE